MKAEGQYTIKKATEYGIGGSVNGTGRRPKITGFYVLNRQGRRVRAFTGPECESKAQTWADFCNENFDL